MKLNFSLPGTMFILAREPRGEGIEFIKQGDAAFLFTSLDQAQSFHVIQGLNKQEDGVSLLKGWHLILETMNHLKEKGVRYVGVDPRGPSVAACPIDEFIQDVSDLVVYESAGYGASEN